MRNTLLFGFAIWAAAAVLAASRPGSAPATCQGSPVASCASAGCHGGGEVGKTFSEQSTWAAGDPHVRAYRVLFNSDSARMMKNMAKTPGYQGDAFENANCLACHSANTDICYDQSSVNAAADGVGCDACHGPSFHWRAAHYEPGWKARSDQAALGFWDTKDLVTRIENCAGCHVGDAKRTVNHDLIAAGHPRLAFEYARFHYQPTYKKHWTEELPEREFEIRSWFLGQVVSLKVAVERTQAWQPLGPEPEFSEQSCFSCHAQLDSVPRRLPGVTPIWQPWHVSLLDVLSQQTSTVFPGAAAPSLASLRKFQKVMADMKPDNAAVKAESAKALVELKAWIDDLRRAEKSNPSRQLAAAELRALARSIARSGTEIGDYDVATGHYLALAALHHADSATLANTQDLLKTLQKQLKYGPNTTSPIDFRAVEAQKIFRQLAEAYSP